MSKSSKKAKETDVPKTRKKATKTTVLGEFWEFLRVRKKYWLLPIVVFLLLLGTLIVLTESTAIGSYIYALF